MASFRLGGLLSGLGQGMVAQDKADRDSEEKRRAALERARQLELNQNFQREMIGMKQEFAASQNQENQNFKREMVNNDQEFKREINNSNQAFKASERAAEQESKKGLLSTTVTGKDGVYGVTAGGDKIDLDIEPMPKGKGKKGSGSGDGSDDLGIGMTSAEKRTYEELKDQYHDAMNKKTDWKGFITHLRKIPAERGGKRWNEIADQLAGTINANMSESKAKQQAEMEAVERDAFWGEGFGKKSKEDWIADRVIELQGVERSASKKDLSQTHSMEGQGTTNNPFVATTQTQIDWFKSHAPSGSIIVIDGVKYTK